MTAETTTYRVTFRVRGAHRIRVGEFPTYDAATTAAIRWAKSNGTGDYIATVDRPGGYRVRYAGAGNSLGYTKKAVG